MRTDGTNGGHAAATLLSGEVMREGENGQKEKGTR